jgi:hypothetical protein
MGDRLEDAPGPGEAVVTVFHGTAVKAGTLDRAGTDP